MEENLFLDPVPGGVQAGLRIADFEPKFLVIGCASDAAVLHCRCAEIVGEHPVLALLQSPNQIPVFFLFEGERVVVAFVVVCHRVGRVAVNKRLPRRIHHLGVVQTGDAVLMQPDRR